MGQCISKQTNGNKDDKEIIKDLQQRITQLENEQKLNFNVNNQNPSIPVVTAVPVEVEHQNAPPVFSSQVPSAPPFPSVYNQTNTPNNEIDETQYSNNSFKVTGTSHPRGNENGKYFQFHPQDMISILKQNGGHIQLDSQKGKESTVHIKENQGFVLRARNERTNKEDGILLWIAMGQGYGCWNPSEFATIDDWKFGDTIVLLDFPCPFFITSSKYAVQDVQSYKALTDIGWNISPDKIRFGQCGIVGGWWKQMIIEFNLDSPSNIVGVWSDSFQLPYSIKYKDLKTGEWIEVLKECKGSITFPNQVFAQQFILAWESTDMHQTGGLSTYRGGGGIHAELIRSVP